jgi:hypothetical protein
MIKPASRLLHYLVAVSVVVVVSIGVTVVVSIGATVVVSIVVVVVSELVEVSELLLQAVTTATIVKIANNFFMCLKFEV